jgi:hypothetical protein
VTAFVVPASPPDHHVEIGQLETRCHVLGGERAAQQVRTSLDRSLEHQLPQALARAAESVLDGLDGVVRIHRLHIRLDLGVALDDFAERLAERIAGLLRSALVSGSGEVMTWPDHDAYVADYLARRLGLTHAPAWPFADLATLDHLPAERAAAEVVLRRPAVLARLARTGAASGAAEDVVLTWPAAAQAILAARLVLETDPFTTAELTAAVDLVGALRGGGGAPPGSEEQLAAAALKLTLRALAAGSAEVSVPAVVAVALAVVAARSRRAGSAPTSRPPLPVSDPVARAVERSRNLVGDRVVPLVADGTGPGAREPAPPQREDDPALAAAPLRSPYAGLALLVPSALSLDALDWLTPTQLAQVAWQTLVDPERDELAHDPAVAQLFPVDPRQVDPAWSQPDPPPVLVDRLCEEAAASYHAAPPGERWSGLLLADLACRLPGLKASSAAYLRHQFLLRAGTVATDADRVTVRLDPVPLGVVLRMVGHGSPPQRMPHVGDRWLVLDLREGGR